MPLFSRDPFRKLKRRIGEHKVFDRREDLVVYAVDASYTAPPGRHDPDLVVLPESAGDVAETIRFARESGMKVIPRGTGTGMSAGAVPIGGGIVVSTEKMTRITNQDVHRQWIQVEPGITNEAVKQAAAKNRLAYPPDPSSYQISTIGGNIAENAGGLRCVKYGTTKDYVLGLRYVDAMGEIVSTGELADSPEPIDLTPLLIGSEGLFGLIVEARLALIPAPKATHTLLAHFDSIDAAVNVIGTILPELVPSVLEFMDSAVIEAIQGYDPYPFPEGTGAALLVETDGDPEPAKLEAERVFQVIEEQGALEVHTARNPVERERLWNLRRLVSPSLSRLASGKMNEDVVVPVGRLPEMITRVREIADHYKLLFPIYGHAGDGNMHINVMYDRDDKREHELAHRAIRDCFKTVIELGGTISGEHGIGAAKIQFMNLQFSEQELEVLRALKRAFDPDGLFNPNKLIPPA